MDYEIVSRNPITLKVNGVLKTVAELAKEHEIPATTIKYRINGGKSFDEVISKEKKNKKKLYEYNGKIYTIRELERKYRVSSTVIRKRLKKGQTLEEALSKKSRRICRAQSFRDCFQCRFSDCIVDGDFPGVDFNWCGDW